MSIFIIELADRLNKILIVCVCLNVRFVAVGLAKELTKKIVILQHLTDETTSTIIGSGL